MWDFYRTTHRCDIKTIIRLTSYQYWWTYSDSRASFTQCNAGRLDQVLPSLTGVAVKIVGGKDTTASQSINSVAMITIGWIAFTSSATGVVAVDNSTNSNKLFASQVTITSCGTQTLERGDVSLFTDSPFDLTPDSFGNSTTVIMQNIRKRQAYGIERGHTSAIGGNASFGITINAPNDVFINTSSSSILVIQMGNGSFSTKTYSVLTVLLDNGSARCEVNQDVSAARPTNPLPAGVNPYGLRTYEMNLSSFSCEGSDSLTDVLSTLRSVRVQASAANNLSQASTGLANNTLIHVGWIAFK